MDHKPFESMLVSEEPLSQVEKQLLQEHIESCASCRQLSISWGEVNNFFEIQPLAKPLAGFTSRWQARLIVFNARELEIREKRASWVFFASTAAAALVVFLIMVVQFLNSFQTPLQVFITGAAMFAGLVNLASAAQVAFIPIVELVVVRVPSVWWFAIAGSACILILALTFSVRRILYPRRVSL
ncbi:MAG: hypothetical protein JSV42_12440 [Chloroflexota bacterium]|nr:MAG: hypothetical protein JSV42_12440 [Chloroflexota bacterium]